VEGAGLIVVKRDDTREPWDRQKMVAGIDKALANRPVTDEQVERLATRVEERLRRKGPEITSQQVGLEVLQGLQKLDHVAYVRFASVYKDFQELGDFERELGALVPKEPAKRRAR
jgi:transcriptional repressor NrdR